MAKPVTLEYGRHDLKVFQQAPFNNWSLPQAPIFRNGAFKLKFRRNLFSIAPSRMASDSVAETLVHILKDPVRPENVLVLRKPDAQAGPLGYLNAYTVFPTGEEQLVGYSKLTEHRAPSAAYLSSVGVVRHSFDPSILAAECERLQGRGDAYGFVLLKKASDPFAVQPPQPGIPSVSYRGARLGHLLIVLSEELATNAGFRTLYTNAFKETAGFVTRHGWKVLQDKKDSIWCVKHLRKPAGWREWATAQWSRLWKQE